MNSLTELDAFYTDYRLCGELDTGVDGSIVWFACECGARVGCPLCDDDTPAPP